MASVLRTLRQPRYAALGALMLLVAIICVGAGTWQIARFEQKRHENDALRVNAHRPSTTDVGSLLPLVGHGPAPSTYSVEFRSVRVTGSYGAAGQALVRGRTLGDDTGFLVITPLRTAGATLLVARGFVAQPSSGAIPDVAAPPAGTVTITARLRPPESRDDDAAQLTQHQVESINPTAQATRLGVPVYNGYAQLDPSQPGTAGLHDLGTPSLGNPAGGAVEPQHFAYVIQWYLFAALALAAPVVMARAETQQGATAAPTELDYEPDYADPVAQQPAEDQRAARLADRYGRAVRR